MFPYINFSFKIAIIVIIIIVNIVWSMWRQTERPLLCLLLLTTLCYKINITGISFIQREFENKHILTFLKKITFDITRL